jgi:zinc transport system ATP-binding protein
MKTLIETQNISYVVGTTHIVQDVSFALHENSIVGLIGPNGAGKSTLVYVLIGALRPTTGEVHIAPNVRIAYIPQLSATDTHALPIAVHEFMAIASSNARFPWIPASLTKRMQDALAQVGLDASLLTQDMRTLSGGERQRVLLARALLSNPHVLILDEPFSAVDYHARDDLYKLLTRLRTQNTLSILLVSHDIESVVETCDSVLCLNRSLHHGCHPIEFMEHGHTMRAVHHHNE